MWVEYRSLIARKTWVLVTLPSGRKAVRCKWVFKTKRNADGSLARYKARLVAKGFSQVHGIDYNDTFAPTVKFTTLRIIFSLAAHYGMELEQTDIDCAFLYADLEEDIYMTQAPEFEQQGPNGEELVYHLKKSVYGLKQAPHDWYLKLREHMLGQGFAQLKTDPGAYIYRSGNTFSIVAIYVDDILICSNCTTWVVQFKRNLAEWSDSNHATMTSQGKATCGFYFTICGGAVSYKSLLQPIVTLSTAEAEYVAMAIATQEVMSIRQMLQELGLALDGPTPIGEDNQACIAIATNDVTSSRTKHMDIRYHFVREAYMQEWRHQ
eukprot:jgi/Tetstr1/425260/TSEL_015713.t1